MDRVLVIGCGGSGKTTLALEIGRAAGLPVIHLDEHYWRPGWEPTPAAAWERAVAELIRRPRWVMDGNYGGTLEMRMAAADTIVFLDLPRSLCLWRVVWRRLAWAGRSRPSVPAGCPERLSLEFLAWIWGYPRRRRGAILARLDEVAGGTRVMVLRSRAEVAAFRAGLEGARALRDAPR